MGLNNIIGQNATLSIEYHAISARSYSVHLLLKSDPNSNFNLADQNYRIFYNAESVKIFDETLKSKLDRALYSNANLVEKYKFDLSYSKSKIANATQLGLLNFDVGLLCPEKGGLVIKDQWTEVISFEIMVTADFEISDLIIAQEGITNELATAFTQFSEWLGSYNTSPKGVVIEQTNNQNKSRKTNFNIGPNPTSDYLFVQSEQLIKGVRVYDGKGTLMNTYRPSVKSARLNISEYIDGLYTIEIEDFEGFVSTHKIAKVSSTI